MVRTEMIEMGGGAAIKEQLDLLQASVYTLSLGFGSCFVDPFHEGCKGFTAGAPASRGGDVPTYNLQVAVCHYSRVGVLTGARARCTRLGLA